jgi:hypothetical protein
MINATINDNKVKTIDAMMHPSPFYGINTIEGTLFNKDRTHFSRKD